MSADLIGSIAGLRARLDEVRSSGATIGFVPTMGALHAGHAKLIETARADCRSVTVSIFVNPLQFDREDDLRRYPRTLDADREFCRALGVDFVFAPPVEEIYPTPPLCTVDIGHLADYLCGPFRPGHFRSVATIVAKLLNIVQPHRAYFGEKDFQQLTIVQRLVADLNIRSVVVGVPTVREADGLALSSRNQRLGPAERPLAAALYRALQEADRLIRSGEADVSRITTAASAQIPADPLLRLEYLEIVSPNDLQPLDRVEGLVRIAGALWVGAVRLIDNVESMRTT